MIDKLKKIDKLLLLKEKKLADQLHKKLKDARNEILYYFGESDTENPSFLLNQIDKIIDKTKDDFLLITDILLKDIRLFSITNQIFLIVTFLNISLGDDLEKQIQGLVSANPDKNLNSVINLFLDRFFDRLKNDLKLSVMNGISNDFSDSDLKKVIADNVDSQTKSLQRFSSYIGQIVYHAAALDAINSVNTYNGSSLKKQWVSVLDNKTTPVCNALEGQIQDVNDPFVDPLSGSKFMYPPAVYGLPGLDPQWHPCRSMAVPYDNSSTN